jgi:hypothetical protein
LEAQLSFNALLAAQVAVIPDQVPTAQRGMVWWFVQEEGGSGSEPQHVEDRDLEWEAGLWPAEHAPARSMPHPTTSSPADRGVPTIPSRYTG